MRMPRTGRPFTVDDLERTPDDGHRYELLDGVLLVGPAPILRHQYVVTRLVQLLSAHCPDELFVMAGPVGVRESPTTELQPDLVVVPKSDLDERYITKPPLLVVEVRSPSTALVDLNLENAAYEMFGVPSYWVVDPDSKDPGLVAFELREGRDAEAASVSGAEVFHAATPFRFDIVPRDLVT